MSSSFLRNRKFLLTLGAAVAGGGYFYYQNRTNCFFNQKWEKIGRISHLYIYPVKSCSHIEVSQIQATQMGATLENNLGDRVFMVINENKELCTARSFPRLVLIKPSYDENYNTLILSANGFSDYQIDLDMLRNDDERKDIKNATIWESKVNVIDLGDAASEWITKVCDVGSSGKLRLVYYPETKCVRKLREKHKIYKEMSEEHIGALQDATSFMLLNNASLDDLNTKLEKPVDPTQFRPNIVIEDAKPYDEDNWKFIKIGDKTVMKTLKPCTRGTFSAVDQKTGEHSKDGEPLKTLNTYRKIDGLPVMGVNVGVFQSGEIKIGDDVFVSYKKDDKTSNSDTKGKFSSYIFLNDNVKK
uniref:CSON012457 protein n=1 Tax=Culicoides sonorensis TaxID=179676 RepID=A0A336KM92_CULSO